MADGNVGLRGWVGTYVLYTPKIGRVMVCVPVVIVMVCAPVVESASRLVLAGLSYGKLRTEFRYGRTY